VDKLYINSKKNPGSVDYGHPLIKQVLEETHGCIIFQEQVMELCHVVAGFPKAECNKLRKMMKPVGSGSENIDKARALEEKFVSGASLNGVSKDIARELYKNILYFSGYGFNKSHAVSYAINSYYCAWLLTYYEQEWIQSYLEAASGNPKKLAKAISEAKGLGYNIVPLDINSAEKAWTCIDNNSLMPSFLSCKGIGAAAVDEILANRPYSGVKDLFWNEDGSWKHSKFNKRTVDSLIKIRAFRSLNIVGEKCEFSSYKQMSDVIINNYNDIKHRTKKDPFKGMNKLKELILEYPNGTEEWSYKELMDFEKNLLGSINVESVIPSALLEKLDERGIESLDNHEEKDLYWFMVIDAAKKLTKNKKPYFLLSAISSSGKVFKIFCWGTPADAEMDPYTFCVGEVEKNDFGMATKWFKIKSFSL
jgi:DNA polymerase-3 subunit alpha